LPTAEIGHAVAIDITWASQHRWRSARLPTSVPGEASRRGTDLLLRLHGPVGVQEQDPGGPRLLPVVCRRARRRPGRGHITVEIAERGQGVAELVEVVEQAREASGERADLCSVRTLPSACRNRIQIGAAVGAAVVVEGSADGQVGHTVAVEITRRGEARSEAVGVVQSSGEAPLQRADVSVTRGPRRRPA
jgi:hypothetical protein